MFSKGNRVQVSVVWPPLVEHDPDRSVLTYGFAINHSVNIKASALPMALG